MKTRLTLKPGQKGTKKLLRQYGDDLVCVRYRYDEATRKRYKTVEIVVEEIEWPVKSPLDGPETVVGIQVQWGELDMWKRVKDAGGKWDARRKIWLMPQRVVEQLGLVERIVESQMDIDVDAIGGKSN